MKGQIQASVADKSLLTFMFGVAGLIFGGIALLILIFFSRSLFAWFFIAVFGFMAYFFVSKIIRIWQGKIV